MILYIKKQFEIHRRIFREVWYVFSSHLRIDLTNLNLSRLPIILLFIPRLRSLHLSHNQLKELPWWLGLKNIRILHLDNNQFSEIPKVIFSFKKLWHLYLAHNQIKVFPEAMCTFKDLSQLDLSHNLLTGIYPMINYPELGLLLLNDNNIEIIPESINNSTRLYRLYVNNNPKLSALPNIDKLTHLQELYMDNTEIRQLPIGIENTEIAQKYIHYKCLVLDYEKFGLTHLLYEVMCSMELAKYLIASKEEQIIIAAEVESRVEKN